MIVDCSTETSAAIHWSQNTVNMPLFCWMQMGWAPTDMRTGTGVHCDSSNSKIPSLARWFHSLSIRNQALRGGVFWESQRSDTSLRASDLLITNVCLQGRVDSLMWSAFKEIRSKLLWCVFRFAKFCGDRPLPRITEGGVKLTPPSKNLLSKSQLKSAVKSRFMMIVDCSSD